MMPVASRVKVDHLCYVRKEGIMPELVKVIRKAAEDGKEVEEVKACVWSLLNTHITTLPHYRFLHASKFASCDVWHKRKERRSYSLHIYVPNMLNVIIMVEGKVLEDLRSAAAVVVANHLANKEEAERLIIPKNLITEVKHWARWRSEF